MNYNGVVHNPKQNRILDETSPSAYIHIHTHICMYLYPIYDERLYPILGLPQVWPRKNVKVISRFNKRL